MKYYAFPFDACEKINEGIIKQPVSASINIISCIIILYFYYYAKTNVVRFLFGTFFVFQLWHAFSHTYHIHSNIQANVSHIISYILSFSALYAILYLSNSTLTNIKVIIITLLIIIDLYIWVFIGGVWNIITNLSILAFIIFSSYNKLPKFFKQAIPYLVVGLIILFALEINEAYNCEKMLEYKQLPYHSLVEIVGLLLFTSLTYLFFKWEKTNIYIYNA
jgi:hypothetical protein